MIVACPKTPRHEADFVGCGHIFESDEDSEGFHDCPHCGLFFKTDAATPVPAPTTATIPLAIPLRVRFRRPDGLVVDDTVRCFVNNTKLLEPHGRNTLVPGAILTEHSWIPLADILAFL
jgi:hypothetical protein